MDIEQKLTPSAIVSELDKYIIGQQEAKKAVAIALRNRWRRMQAASHIREEIMPNNILMIGATGVGKTEIARRLAKLVQAPFIKVEASKFTEVGYVGRDVESMIKDLLQQGINMVKAQHKQQVLQKAQEQAENIILDILLPPMKNSLENAQKFGLEITDANAISEQELNHRTREKIRAKLQKGELDHRKIEIEIEHKPTAQVIGPIGVDDMAANIEEMLSSIAPKRTKKRTVTIAEARRILTDQEAQKLIDMDSVISEAIRRVETSGIVFIDEVDKIAGKSNNGGPDVSREGVQRDLLPIVEGSTVSTRYGNVRTDHILFIAAGAFHVSKPSDLIPEFQGRFPIRVELQSLSEEDFFRILTEPENALTKQYKALFEAEGFELEFEEGAIRAMAKIAYQVNNEIENIGARRLHTILTALLNDYLFLIPDQITEKKIVITEEIVHQKLQHLVQNKDLSQYIL
ncbi:MAG: ATP-dependent protease ATPase subunit HslU [Bacteroidia bacterium]|nr:ATP-dependent protease ATPase subunit HslU [Bacteroidia bacterium]MDW8301340.1 ATP-dependent protease ATPase subunit HslU [Bacteroidia bacterium]